MYSQLTGVLIPCARPLSFKQSISVIERNRAPTGTIQSAAFATVEGAMTIGETRGLCGEERRPSLDATLACERLPLACPVLAWSRASPSVARARAAIASTRSDHRGRVVLCLLCAVFHVP